MATYGLVPNGLIDSGMELRGVTHSIEASLENLNPFVQRFIAANVGGGASSYQNAQNTWNQGMDQMRASMATGAAAIDEIRNTYHVADAQGASLFGGHV